VISRQVPPQTGLGMALASRIVHRHTLRAHLPLLRYPVGKSEGPGGRDLDELMQFVHGTTKTPTTTEPTRTCLLTVHYIHRLPVLHRETLGKAHNATQPTERRPQLCTHHMSDAKPLPRNTSVSSGSSCTMGSLNWPHETKLLNPLRSALQGNVTTGG
jgi:hypothetical protein